MHCSKELNLPLLPTAHTAQEKPSIALAHTMPEWGAGKDNNCLLPITFLAT